MFKFSERSKENLRECHPDLIRLFEEVIKVFDCAVIEGHRGEEEQNKAYYSGKSKLKYPQSKHNKIPSMAVDVVPWHKEAPHIRWNDRESFVYMAGIVKGIAAQMGIKIRHGLDWDGDNDLKDQTFFDLPHFEIC